MTAELSKEEILRYSRHLIVPEVTLEGQKKLKSGSVLLIGTGGLGAPVSMYLAAAGIGRLGLVDFDKVDFTNLQRQVLFTTPDVGRPKLDAAKDRLAALNPHVQIDTYEERFSSENALRIIKDYDIVIDGTDNFPTRYCVNDACVLLGKTNIYGSIFRFEGQASVFKPREGPCYRCLYPEPPPPGLVPSCAEGGVLGILPGIIGVIQATEAIKVIIGEGTPLIGRLLMFNALEMSFRQVKLRRDPSCPICGDRPTIRELVDYEQFCGIRGEESNTIIHEDKIPEITVKQLKERLDRGDKFELIDVREIHEHQICNLKQATLIPLGTLPSRIHELDSSREYVIHCKMGGRSAQAVDFLRKSGFGKVYNVVGGITAWAKEIDPTMPTY